MVYPCGGIFRLRVNYRHHVSEDYPGTTNPMEEELNFTLEEAHNKLNKDSERAVGKTIERMLSEIDEMIKTQQFSSAWTKIGQTIRICDAYGVYVEMAEARVECACYIYKLGDLVRAAEYLNQAVERYCPDQHRVAMTLWILGCVYWELPGESDNAINAWRRSRSLIRGLLADDYFMPSELKIWYQERYEDMGEDLEKKTLFRKKQAVSEKVETIVTQITEPVSAGDDSAGGQNRPTHDASWPVNDIPKGQRESSKKQRLKPAFLKWWPVFSAIPAGIPTGLLMENPDYRSDLQVHQFQIDDFLYQVHDIHGDSLSIAIDLRIHYFVLRVTGDSMNQAEINEGDYVLLRSGDIVNSNDIVAVDILGVDAQSTLKRYIVQDRKFIFRPESNNPIHRPYEFRKGDDSEKQYLVRGAVVAVLKRIES